MKGFKNNRVLYVRLQVAPEGLRGRWLSLLLFFLLARWLGREQRSRVRVVVVVVVVQVVAVPAGRWRAWNVVESSDLREHKAELSIASASCNLMSSITCLALAWVVKFSRSLAFLVIASYFYQAFMTTNPYKGPINLWLEWKLKISWSPRGCKN